ncbi:MAG: hypothetical protein V1707_02015 [bacterium]
MKTIVITLLVLANVILAQDEPAIKYIATGSKRLIQVEGKLDNGKSIHSIAYNYFVKQITTEIKDPAKRFCTSNFQSKLVVKSNSCMIEYSLELQNTTSWDKPCRVVEIEGTINESFAYVRQQNTDKVVNRLKKLASNQEYNKYEYSLETVGSGNANTFYYESVLIKGCEK